MDPRDQLKALIREAKDRESEAHLEVVRLERALAVLNGKSFRGRRPGSRNARPRTKATRKAATA